MIQGNTTRTGVGSFYPKKMQQITSHKMTEHAKAQLMQGGYSRNIVESSIGQSQTQKNQNLSEVSPLVLRQKQKSSINA